jgi:transposase
VPCDASSVSIVIAQARNSRYSWGTFFVFLEDPGVPPTNNACERELRPSVIFRKVTGGFRADCGAQIHAGYRSITGTARLHGKTALKATNHLLADRFDPSRAC